VILCVQIFRFYSIPDTGEGGGERWR